MLRSLKAMIFEAATEAWKNTAVFHVIRGKNEIPRSLKAVIFETATDGTEARKNTAVFHVIRGKKGDATKLNGMIS